MTNSSSSLALCADLPATQPFLSRMHAATAALTAPAQGATAAAAALSEDDINRLVHQQRR